jgi:putative ABC transport system substrate-binding protein
MRRREFIALLGSSAVAFPLSSKAQSRIPLVGVLLYGPMAASNDLQIADELRRAGYIEDRDIVYVVRAAEGDATRLSLLARELVAAKPDVIVGQSSQVALALVAATDDIPIVMTAVGDPIGLGLTTGLSEPTLNVTGFTISSPSLGAKRLQLLRELMPKLHRVGYLGVPANPMAPLFERRVEEAAATLGITLVPLPVKSEAEIDSAFQRAEDDAVEAVIAEADPLTLRFAATIIDHCLVYGIPCIHA